MTRSLTMPLRLVLALAATLAVALPAVPALGQGTPTGATAQLSIDAPAANATISTGTQVDIGGWAADPAGPGTGIDIVRVYLDNKMEANGTLLGDANYGSSRPDVAQSLGNPALANTGFNLLWTPTNVSNGQHTLYVYAHSAASNWVYKTVQINVQVAATPTPSPRRGPYGGGPYDNGPYDQGYGNGYPGQYQQGPYQQGPYQQGPYPPMGPPGMYPGYPGGYPYPPGGGYPYPSQPGNGGGQVCIMIYPPPPGC